jgi:small subunit ribosomal protein S17
VVTRGRRKVRTGFVVRVKQDKTAVVEMVWKQRHRLYHKQVRRVGRFHVHDPENQCRLGDVVRIEETRPISKTKHWRLIEILERRQVAEVRPIELEGDALMELDIPEEEEAVVEMDEDIDPDLLDLLVTGDGGYEDDEEEDD